MQNGTIAAILLSVALAGCAHGTQGGIFVPDTFGRPVLPPQQNVVVGSLYYVRETPTDSFSRPAALQPLCILNLADYDVATLPPNSFGDYNLLRSLEMQGSLSGLNTTLASVGLKGGVERYYELKLTNVSKTSSSRDDAEAAFDRLRAGPKCARWFNNTSQFAIYQVESVYVGDLVFARRGGISLDANVSAKARPSRAAD